MRVSSTLSIMLLLVSAPALADGSPDSCADLQSALLALSAGGGGTYRFTPGHVVSCSSRSEPYKGSASRHGLLVPEDVTLDLNLGRIDLHLSDNGYGVRLTSRSTIQHGEVRLVSSESLGAIQSIFHSVISVGAAYGDGGTAAAPSYFSKIGYWSIRGVWVSQPIARSAIQVMSESHHGLIDHVLIRNSELAVIGIGFDWGTVGAISAADADLPQDRVLWQQGLAYTTHPHDITIQNTVIERLGSNASADNAGIRTSACHNMTIRNVTIHEAGSGVTFRAGDLGYEFAQEGIRQQAHKGLVIDGITVLEAHRHGVILDGLADNVYRARLNPDIHYDALLDPVYPGLDAPWVRFGTLRGAGEAESSGVHMQYVRGGLVEGIDSQQFQVGVRLAQSVYSTTVWRSWFLRNTNLGVWLQSYDAPPPTYIAIRDNEIHSNGTPGPAAINIGNAVDVQREPNDYTP